MDDDDPFKDISPQQFLAWLEAQPPEFRTAILQIMLKRAPDALIENVRRLRDSLSIRMRVTDFAARRNGY